MTPRRAHLSIDADDARRLVAVLDEAIRDLPGDGMVAEELRVAYSDLRLRVLIARSKLRGEVVSA